MPSLLSIESERLSIGIKTQKEPPGVSRGEKTGYYLLLQFLGPYDVQAKSIMVILTFSMLFEDS